MKSKFEFLKDKDQYRLNTLTKMLMEKYGFITYFDTDILPLEVAETNCNKVYVDVQSIGNLFSTKLRVVLKDCKNIVLFTSAEGKSKEKEYPVAYNQSLREAFTSFDKLTLKDKKEENLKPAIENKENSQQPKKKVPKKKKVRPQINDREIEKMILERVFKIKMDL